MSMTTEKELDSRYGFDPALENRDENFRAFEIRAEAYAMQKGFLSLLKGTMKASTVTELEYKMQKKRSKTTPMKTWTQKSLRHTRLKCKL